MPVIRYPFIDIAVHDSVRAHFAGGEAVVLFSADMADVLWANGRGAGLFGYESVYDFLDHGPPLLDLSFRQIAAAARQLSAAGAVARLTIRIPSGFQRLAVPASCRVVEACGQPAVLFSAPVERAPASPVERARSMIEGLDDPDTHIAIVDGEGEVIAASAGFADLGLTAQTARMLTAMAGSDASRLVKRPVPTAKGNLPAAMGKVSSHPALHLLFVVEASPAGASQPSPAEPERRTDDEESVLRDASDGFREAIDAVSQMEEATEPEEESALDLPVPANAPSADATAPEAEAEEPSPAPGPSSPAARATDQSGETPEVASQVQPRIHPAGETFVFRPDSRATRFVWKIDAEGRFCEISEEFARAVGPHAADIGGMAFADVAALFHLDPDGKIADLLRKRDTWSGKTIWWPVEGTSLVVPIDLAALPTYTRSRIFDGFRGFGIIRIGDAIKDPHAVGLSLGIHSQGEPATGDGDESRAETEEKAELRTDEPDGEADAAGSTEPDALADTTTENPVETDGDHHLLDEAETAADPAAEPTTEDEPLDWPKGERLALRLVDNSLPASDTVIPIDQRRKRDSLSPVEQAAFREIARQLDTFIGRRDEEERLEPVQSVDAGAGEGDDAVSAITTDAASEPAVEEEVAVQDMAPEASVEDDGVAAEEENASLAGEADGFATDETAELLPEERAIGTIPSLHRERDGLSAEILDQMPVALLVHTGDRLIHGNPEFLRLTGYDSIAALAEVGGLDALLQRQELEDKTDQAGGMAVVRADDIIVPVTARLQSVRFDQAGALMLALMPVAGADNAAAEPEEPKVVPLSPSRLPEQAARLQVEVEELRAILETATDGVVVIDAEGSIRSMNGAASALFNYDSEEAVGRPFVMLFAHESQRAIVDYLGGLSGHGVASVLNDGREVIGREASGGFIPLFMTIGRLTSSNGYCAVIRDITQWKRTEDELRSAKRSAESANAHKSEFLAHVSHEIRTPLNAIIGFADLMATEHFGAIGHPRYVEYANDIVRSGRHVLDIVNDLLDISKIEAGEMELDFAAVELNETISEAVSLVQPQANGQRVIIRTALSHAVPPVVADLRSVKQIVLNILSNAIRFTPAGGQIVVSTVYEANGSVVLRVRDTGIGMTRQELETAMKPFRQVAGGTRKRGDGTGLGLPLTKAMADANRANFSIQSTPHEGTLVEITFPSQRVLAN